MRLPDGDRGLTELLDLGYDLLRLYAKKPLTMEHGSPEMAGRFSCLWHAPQKYGVCGERARKE